MRSGYKRRNFRRIYKRSNGRAINKLTCKISNKYLIKSCPDQDSISGPKCFNNKCYNIDKIISANKDISFAGNVVRIIIKSKSYIVKWNRDPLTKESMINEINIQNKISDIGLAPKIYSFYEDASHFFIFMDDLIELGYDTIASLYKYKNPEKSGFRQLDSKVVNAITSAFEKLHILKIAHRDAHAYNIFYNKELNDIKFIDFGTSKEYETTKEALTNEQFLYDIWTSQSKIPLEWSTIKEKLYKKFLNKEINHQRKIKKIELNN